MTTDTTDVTDVTDSVVGGTRVYWCVCGWSGSGVAAMEAHLDRYDDGSDAHVEMVA